MSTENSIISLQSKIEALEARRQELFKMKEPIDKELQEHYKELEILRNKVSELELAKPMSNEDEIKFHLEEADGSVRYRAAMEYWHNKGFWVSGYYPDTNQRALQLTLTKGDPTSFTKTVAAIKEVLPFIKQQKGGKRVFGVFEHTLSEFGVYNVLEKNGVWSLEKTTYGRPEVLKTFPSVEEMVKYIQTRHYYDTKEGDDE